MQSSGFQHGALSLLTPIGYQSGDCGYCKAEDSSQRTPQSRASYYARSKLLSPEHYQILMDRGWRRSGSLLYLPDASRSCCPHYTIRLAASQFKPTRDQRQTLYRWNRYVLGEKYLQEASVKFPKTKEEKRRLNTEFDLLSTVHSSEFSNLHPGLHPEHRFEVTLEPDTFTEEKFSLFANYQRFVHRESESDISRSGFKRFLCSSPLIRQLTSPEGNPTQHLGSFHQCYRLDGRLIAMAVLDLLPHAVSGVYFIYHSEFEKWSFGKISACREAGLAMEGGYEFYYMGYYIHSCKKMRYKGEFKLQFVLDNVSLGWDPLDDEVRGLMERRRYASMSEERARKVKEGEKEKEEGEKKEEEKEEEEKEAEEEREEEKKEGGDIEMDSQDEISHPSPLDAMESGLSLLKLGMPGVLSLERVKEEINLDAMKLHAGQGKVHFVTNITMWDGGDEMDRSSLKGLFAEFAAVLGPELATEVIVDFA